jgi:hypothetical protein
MEVHFTPELEKKLNDLAARSARPADELAETREMLDRRYDDIKGGKVKMIPGDEAFAGLMAKTEAERKRSQ